MLLLLLVVMVVVAAGEILQVLYDRVPRLYSCITTMCEPLGGGETSDYALLKVSCVILAI